MLDEAQVIQWDLIKASIHEAGHLAVLWHFGGDGTITLVRVHDGLDVNRSVVGRCSISRAPWSAIFNEEAITGRHRRQGKIVHLAGLVAETYFEALTDGYELDAAEFMDYLGGGIISLSQTDAEGTGRVTFKLVEETISVVRELWPDILSTAKESVEEFGQSSGRKGDRVIEAAAITVALQLQSLRDQAPANPVPA